MDKPEPAAWLIWSGEHKAWWRSEAIVRAMAKALGLEIIDGQ